MKDLLAGDDFRTFASNAEAVAASLESAMAEIGLFVLFDMQRIESGAISLDALEAFEWLVAELGAASREIRGLAAAYPPPVYN